MVLWDIQSWSLQCWDVKGCFSSPQQLHETVPWRYVVLRAGTGNWKRVLWPMSIHDSQSYTEPEAQLLACHYMMMGHIEECHWLLLEKLSLH